MKELSIEEKAARYDEAIERVENIKTGKCEITFMFTEELFEHIFPELKESKDERIRKHLISLFEKFVTLGVANECETSEIKVDDILAWLEKQGEQKPAWSEEDESKIKGIINTLEGLYDNFASGTTKDLYRAKIDFLKSLKERCTWKPSEEQMEALDDFIYAKYPNTEKHGAVVKSLYQDLKKLKGE